MKKLIYGISWRTYLRNISEVDGWISAQEFSRLFDIPIENVYPHFQKLVCWGYIKRRNRLRPMQKGYEYEHLISAKGLSKLEYIDNRNMANMQY